METKTKEIEKGFTFKEDGHKYFFDGKPLTGITTILNVIAKPFLIQWAANMATETIKRKWEMGKLYTQEEFDATLEEARLAHRKKKETAGELGTDIHSQIEEIIKEAIKIDGKIPPILKTLSKLPGNEQINHFVNWAVENKVKFLDSEVRIYSKELFLGGTCDFVCEIEKEIWIGDIKTGNGIYPEHFFQTAGYQLLFEEMGLCPKIKGHLILNLKKDGTFEEKRSVSIEDNKEAFLSALKIYRVQEKINKVIK